MNCPYCNSQHTIKKGFLKSGKQKYLCKTCHRGFSFPLKIKNNLKVNIQEDKYCPICGQVLKKKSANHLKKDIFVCHHCNKLFDINFNRIIPDMPCPYCQSEDIKKGGKLKFGQIRYQCNTCKKTFSISTKIKESPTVNCPRCKSNQIWRCGYAEDGQRQRFMCKECKYKFTENTNEFFPREYIKINCPNCANDKAKKAGFSNYNEQYYKCTNCGHKFLLHGKYRQLNNQQKIFIIKETIKGKTINSIAQKLKCNEKTVRNVLSKYYKQEKLTVEQEQLIIKYGVQLAVPVEYLAPYVPCTPKKCKEILSKYNINNVRPIKRTEKEKVLDILELNKFIEV